MNDSYGFGDNFQKESKYIRNVAPNEPPVRIQKPELYKRYPDSTQVTLPSPVKDAGMPLWKAIGNRRSRRAFSDKPLSKKTLSQLLWAAQGISARLENYAFRTSPSAGALYPVETYLLINSVDDIPQGIYHYSVGEHCLDELKVGSYGRELAHAALNQTMVAEANAVFIWTAVVDRCKWKYGQRAYRYIYLDAGHIAENLALAAEALDLNNCPIAAFYDEEMNEIIGVDGVKETVIYLSVVGNPK